VTENEGDNGDHDEPFLRPDSHAMGIEKNVRWRRDGFIIIGQSRSEGKIDTGEADRHVSHSLIKVSI
jgi:hypothetical protein